MACLGAAETGSKVAVSAPAKKALATVRSDADEVAGDANAAMAVSSKAAARALVPAMLVSAIIIIGGKMAATTTSINVARNARLDPSQSAEPGT